MHQDCYTYSTQSDKNSTTHSTQFNKIVQMYRLYAIYQIVFFIYTVYSDSISTLRCLSGLCYCNCSTRHTRILISFYSLQCTRFVVLYSYIVQIDKDCTYYLCTVLCTVCTMIVLDTLLIVPGLYYGTVHVSNR